MRKLAAVEGADCGADPAAWFRARYGEELANSSLQSIAKNSSERKQLLADYFEPTEQEREAGMKVPTVAHRAIAVLAAKGYTRVILTTNFDRLMEDALAAAGVPHTVTSSPDAVSGMVPLAHSGCHVIKLHGGYRDTRILNTAVELAKYGPKMRALLDRILDEFGLIVCGWSAEYDTALRDGFMRCKGRRYTTY